MDSEQFGQLTKALAVGMGRRRALRGLALGAVASALALVGAGEVAAQRPTNPGPPPHAKASPKAACMRQCNTEARATRRDVCAPLRDRAKNTCLREAKSAHATCRKGCMPEETEAPS